MPIIRFSRWLDDNVLHRKLPSVVYGTYPKNATIVVKLDIEGSEYLVLPDLISSGALCELDVSMTCLCMTFLPQKMEDMQPFPIILFLILTRSISLYSGSFIPPMYQLMLPE